jgi:hypothetical protein
MYLKSSVTLKILAIYIDRLSTIEFKFPPVGVSTFQKQEKWILISLGACVCTYYVFILSFVGTANLRIDRPQSKDCYKMDINKFRSTENYLKNCNVGDIEEYVISTYLVSLSLIIHPIACYLFCFFYNTSFTALQILLLSASLTWTLI